MSSPPTGPTGCRLKLQRAKLHYDELVRQLIHFIEVVKPYRPDEGVTTQVDTNKFDLVFSLKEDALEPPEEWGPILGDVAHNLMSSLDHLAFELSILNGGSPDRTQTEFPIFDFDDSHTQSKISQDICTLTVADQRRIRDLQPYTRGDRAKARLHELWLLRDMNIIDKHRRLHLTTMAVYSEQVMIDKPAAVTIIDWKVSQGRKTGDEIFRCRISVDPKIGPPPYNVNVGSMAQVFFGGSSGALSNLNVRDAIPRIGKFICDDVFSKFAHRVGPLPPIW